ncbi:hypothetical protein [Tenacibaculum retecalamus]|uniref:hypothetical protein n=1 Tax=Tenacibaculum retecalamus TaxID=3018315 RepID=UPI0023D94EC6|nr:hypothetical protein [Tenacibaculum retecalamus]WBX70332.1 hypothetical protein PG912_08565 [Tenacibaculum retecalamus]
MKIKLLFLLLVFINISLYSQVKIGDNPSAIHPNSILELESTDKALVISRMSAAQMNAIVPLPGALVFNTDANCVFMYNGTTWRSLCNTGAGIAVTTDSTAPVNNNLGDFWINDTQNNTTSIWDGTNWISIDNNPRRGNGVPNTTTAPNATPGDVYVDSTTGIIYAYDGTGWVSSNTTPLANNGLLVDASNTIQLGGLLIKPTIIQTDIINTLAITGLQNGDTTQDAIVTVNNTTGQLRKVSASNLLTEEVINLIATDNQLIFNSGFTLQTTDKINVFRNGVRIDFTVVSPTIIEIEPDAICYAGDQIKIIQLY